jgi:hypothetical protein
MALSISTPADAPREGPLRAQIAFCCIIAAFYAWFASVADAQVGVALFLIFCIICGVIIDTRPGHSIKTIGVYCLPISVSLFVCMYGVAVIDQFVAQSSIVGLLSNFVLTAVSIVLFFLIATVSLPIIVLACLARVQLLRMLKGVLNVRKETRESVKWLVRTVIVVFLIFVSGSITNLSSSFPFIGSLLK